MGHHTGLGVMSVCGGSQPPQQQQQGAELIQRSKHQHQPPAAQPSHQPHYYERVFDRTALGFGLEPHPRRAPDGREVPMVVRLKPTGYAAQVGVEVHSTVVSVTCTSWPLQS